MKPQHLSWLSAAVALCVSASVHAQATPADQPLKVDRAGSGPVPYLLDSQDIITRNNFGQCWRTGYWTVELAANTKVVGSEFPAGCACDGDLMPVGTCTPKAAPVAQPPAPAVVPPAPVPTSEKVTIPTDTLFAFDKAVLTPEGKDKLKTYADQLKALNLEAVVAVGHTDRIGTEKYNKTLSEKRAASVKAYLSELGVPADRIFTEGRGESQPTTGTQCDAKGKEGARNKSLIECLAPDRRVDIESVGTRR